MYVYTGSVDYMKYYPSYFFLSLFFKERLFSGSFFQRGIHSGGTSGKIIYSSCYWFKYHFIQFCFLLYSVPFNAVMTVPGRANPKITLYFIPISGGHHRYAIRSFAPHGGRGSWGVWGNANRGAAGPSGTQQTSGQAGAASSSAVRLRGRQILDHEALTCLLVRMRRRETERLKQAYRQTDKPR